MSDKSIFTLKKEFNDEVKQLKLQHPEWQYNEVDDAIAEFLVTFGKETLEALPIEIINLYDESELRRRNDEIIAQQEKFKQEEAKEER